MDDALLIALGGAAAIIARRHLTSDDDFDAIARAIAYDARCLRVDATVEATRALAMQLRIRELAPAASWTPPTLAELVEHFLCCPVGWADSVAERVRERTKKVGDLAATVELARALDPHGTYEVRRLRRAV